MRIVEYPKSDVEFQQEKEGFAPSKWWQAIDAEGNLLMETSVRSDFNSEHHGVLDEKGVTFRRLYEKTERRWVEEHPFPKQVEWRQISDFPNYEVSEGGKVRDIENKELLSPMFIGDEGYIGFLLKNGMNAYLKGLHEVYASTFPDKTI